MNDMKKAEQLSKAGAKKPSKGAPQGKSMHGNEHRYHLYAEHSEAGTKKLVGKFHTPHEAEAHIHHMESEYHVSNGKRGWPEGSDAILHDKVTGKKHMFTSGWEDAE